MKKVLLIIVIFTIALLSGVMFVSCGATPTSDESSDMPTLQKSSFNIWYTFDDSDTGEAYYNMTWKGENATEYKVVFDGIETTAVEPKLSLNDFAADTVHTVVVTAIGENDTKSEPVEVKFKGVKMAMPVDICFDEDANDFKWKGSDDNLTYRISCEELELDSATGRPVYSGKIKYALAPSNCLTLYDLREIYNNKNLNEHESFRISALPYSLGLRFEYKNDTDIAEFLLPSDFSEQSINFYADKMTNPSNLRWDFDNFNAHRDSANVKWEGAVSDFRYIVFVQGPDGDTRNSGTLEGASEGHVPFDYVTVTGDYNVTVEPTCNEFNFINEDKAAKSITYSFYLPQPITETLHFHANQTVLNTPENVRIEGDNIVWDAVDYAHHYYVHLACGEEVMLFESDSAHMSLNRIFDAATNPFRRLATGDYDIKVMAYGLNEVVSLEDNVPVINTYKYSEYSDTVPHALRLKSFSSAQNVKVDYDNRTIYWDDIPEATLYSVIFLRNSNNVLDHGTYVGKDTQYTWSDDITQYKEIGIYAECEFKVIEKDGIVTIIVPSLYKVNINT